MATVDKIWERTDPDPDAVERLCDGLGCSPIVASVLVNRGIHDVDDARRTLDPSTDDLHEPTLLRDCDAAVERLASALAAGETITVYGDRDLDGVAGTAILATLLQDLDGVVGYHIPRKWDGYGVHEDALDALADRGTDLLLTVDCGTTATEELAVARALGMDVVVTDHHPPDGPLPDVTACLNPRRDDCGSPNDGLAGAGVAFKLGDALVERSGAVDRETFRDYALPLAGVATVADRAPMTPENRAIVRAGYDRIERCPLVGFRALVNDCEVESVRDLGWSVAPLLNAAQEDTDGHLMLQTLLATEPGRAASLLETLEGYRAERKEQRRAWQRTVEREVAAQTDPAEDEILIVETDGYVGGAPGRIAERFGKPVLSYYPKNGGYRGSVTTAADIDVSEVVAACEDLLESRWGHPGAPRFFLPTANVSSFVDRFAEELHRRYSSDALAPRVNIDAVLERSAVGRDVVDAVERVRPFGEEFEEPHFLIEHLDVASVERFGADEEHVALVPDSATCRCVWWNGWSAWETRGGRGRYDVVGSLTWDDVRETVTVSVADVRASEPGER